MASGMQYVREGSGKSLLLLHGIGGSRHSWSTIREALAAERDVIAVDLPGFGDTPPLGARVSIAKLADAVTSFLTEHGLHGVDVAGSSMGARLALELARRGVVGTAVALDPGGFWNTWQRVVFFASVALSIRLVRLLAPVMPLLTRNPVSRTLLFAQFSARPWALSPDVALTEMRTFAASRSFDTLLFDLAFGAAQQGAASPAAPIVIGWGRHDLVTLPSQAKRAQQLFPTARIHWFEKSGHFPQWDVPEETVRLILQSTV